MTADSDPETVPLVEEKAVLATRPVVTGRVRIETRVETIDELVRAELDGEEVDVERVALNQTVEVAPSIRTEGDVTIIPIVEEVLVVEKRLVLKEELRVRRTAVKTTVEVPIELRKVSATIREDR